MARLLRTLGFGLFALALCLPAAGSAQQSGVEGWSETAIQRLSEVQSGAQQLAQQQGQFAGKSIGPQFASATNQLLQVLTNFDIWACGVTVTALHLKRQRLVVAAAGMQPADPALDRAVDEFGRLISQLQELCDRHVHRIYGDPGAGGGAGTAGGANGADAPPTVEEPPRMSVQERICYDRCRQLYEQFYRSEFEYDRARRSAERARARANDLRRAADRAAERARRAQEQEAERQRERARLQRIISDPNSTPAQRAAAADAYGNIRERPPGGGPSGPTPASESQAASDAAKAAEAAAARAEAQASALHDAMTEIYEALQACIRTCIEQARTYNRVTIDPDRVFPGVPGTTPRRPPFYRPAPPALTTPRQQHSSLPLDPASTRMLAVHNSERAEVGVPPLQWDRALQASATAYAGELARTGRLVHSPRAGRGAERENLSKGMLGWSPEQMLRNWVVEKRNFVPGIYPNVTRTGRWEDVSHYTQMIWPTTTRIGCGTARGSGYQWTVCRYLPGGNREGQPVGIRAGRARPRQ